MLPRSAHRTHAYAHDQSRWAARGAGGSRGGLGRARERVVVLNLLYSTLNNTRPPDSLNRAWGWPVLNDGQLPHQEGCARDRRRAGVYVLLLLFCYFGWCQECTPPLTVSPSRLKTFVRAAEGRAYPRPDDDSDGD